MFLPNSYKHTIDILQLVKSQAKPQYANAVAISITMHSAAQYLDRTVQPMHAKTESPQNTKQMCSLQFICPSQRSEDK